MRQQSITQDRGPSPPPNLVAQNDWLNLNQNREADFKQYTQPELPARLPPSRRSAVSIFEPFRNRMRMESGNTIILVLDDGTNIDMGTNSIDTALGMLRRSTDSNGNNVTYKVDGFTPEIEMIILLNGHIILRPPSPSMGRGGRRRTRARKMGRNGRKGTNKRRRYIVAKSRRHRRGNNVCALRRT
jgi:hypothetical protein